jgi:chromatin segregation and condensation protein Rec8/ScpA/Scc1 (kleisin family)
MKALEEYERILYEVNSELCEEDDEPEFVIDEEHLEKVKEDKRVRALQRRLKELTDERQRYEDSIQEEGMLIAKLKERNASPSVIADEQTIIDNSKKAIEELDKQIEVLSV